MSRQTPAFSPQEEPISRLLQAVQTGDRTAFHRLYLLTGPKLFAIALRIVRQQAMAEEILQDAFVKIWARAGDYNPDKGSAMAWMAAIVRYRAIDFQRQREPVDYGEDGALPDWPDPGPGPLHNVIQGESARSLRECLEQLPAEQRQMIMAAYFDGHTHESLAASVEKPLGTVKTWIRRGIQRLRKCLEP